MPHASDIRAISTAHRGASVHVTDLGKEYPHGDHTVPVLRNVNLVLEPGDMVAIVGASGVGKSTLLHVLGTLDLPTFGSILFNGEEITRMNATRLAEFRNREIGFVFQFHHLLPEFTALENVMMPALIQRIPRPAATKRARDILGRVGLARRLTHKPSELSGGEQQRVALARALVLEPSLLLADEPTGNLDKRTGEEIHQLFLELNRERGSTLLVVTHNLELAELMPRCLRMLDGGGLAELHDWSARKSKALMDDRPSELSADLLGEVAGETAGEAAGQAAGEVVGETAGEAAGQAAGEVAGEAAGQAAGEAAGEATGDSVGDPAVPAGEASAGQAAPAENTSEEPIVATEGELR